MAGRVVVPETDEDAENDSADEQAPDTDEVTSSEGGYGLLIGHPNWSLSCMWEGRLPSRPQREKLSPAAMPTEGTLSRRNRSDSGAHPPAA